MDVKATFAVVIIAEDNDAFAASSISPCILVNFGQSLTFAVG